MENSKVSEAPVREVSKVACLEGLRGLLAIWVVIGHILHLSGKAALAIPGLALVTRGDYGVKLFMLLSGFVIALLVYRKREGYVDYLKRRTLRIYPMLFLGIMAGVATHRMRGDLIEGFWPGFFDRTLLEHFSAGWAVYERGFWVYLGAAVTLTNGVIPNWVLPRAATPFNGVIWSLSLEFQFYVVAPLLCRLFRERGRWLVGCLAVFVVMVLRERIFPSIGGMPWSMYGAFLPFNIEWFVMGILSYQLYEGVAASSAVGKASTLDWTAGILLLTAVGDAFRLTGVNGFEEVFGDRLPLMVWVLVMSYIVDVKQGRRGILNRWMAWLLESRVSLWLGRISYSVYLIHVPVIILVQWLVVRHLGVTTWRGCFLATAVLAIPVTLVVAAGCYRWVELPFINLGKRKVKPA
jgi:peptidoglycan/LPS O-acetylase OafA/YrhL